MCLLEIFTKSSDSVVSVSVAVVDGGNVDDEADVAVDVVDWVVVVVVYNFDLE